MKPISLPASLAASAALLAGALAFGAPALAQSTTTPPSATTPNANRPAARNDASRDADRQEVVDASQLERGANSFTEAQARSRMEAAGFTNVRDLKKDDDGFWRGHAMRGGSSTDVALDFRGRIAAGPGLTALGTHRGTVTGSSSPPDGTPGNPPGTAAGRAMDRATGSNTTGTNPSGSGGSTCPLEPAHMRPSLRQGAAA